MNITTHNESENKIVKTNNKNLSKDIENSKGNVKNNVVDEIKENWHKFSDVVHKKWNKLSKSDLDLTEGQSGKLIDSIVRKYDISKASIEKELATLWDKFNSVKEDIID